MSKQGTLYIIAAPSGGGKTSLVTALLQSITDIGVSISHTTRAPRPKERDGEDYHFVSQQAFQAQVEQQAFLEHVDVFGAQYGTSKEWVVNTLAAGQDILLEIDWQGARLIRQLFVEVVSIFILPPSLAVLQQRLKGRKQDTAEVIASRMQQAHSEMSHAYEFDYLIINDDFDQALKELTSIVIATRLKTAQQMQKHQKTLEELTQTG